MTPDHLRAEANMVDAEEGTDCTTRACLLRGAADEIDRLERLRKKDARLYIKALSSLVDAQERVKELEVAVEKIATLNTRLAAAEALLREACVGYENGAVDWSADKRLRVVPIFHAWFERAKGACGE